MESVKEYIDFMFKKLNELSIEDISYSDYDQMTDWLAEINKKVKKLEKKQDPMRPLFRYGEYTCPMCEVTVSKLDEYCWHCGQKLDQGD